MARVLFKGVKQFTSDVFAATPADEKKHYLNLVRKVDEHQQIIENQAEVWFGTRLYANIGGEDVQILQEIINNLIETIGGLDSGGTLPSDYYSGSTYITCATTINEAITILDSAITSAITYINEIAQHPNVDAGPGIEVTPSTSGVTVSVRLPEDEQVLSFTDAGELHGEVRLKRIDHPEDDHFAAQYLLVDKDDMPISGSTTIDIIKDQFLKRVLLTEEFETQADIDEWCTENHIPDYARDMMHVDNAYLVFEWELDLEPGAPDVDTDTYTVIPVRMLMSSLDIVINGVSATTESGVTTITITTDDILTDRDALYLESVDDQDVETYAVGVPEGTDVTTGFEDVMRVCLLYIDGNDVE